MAAVRQTTHTTKPLISPNHRCRKLLIRRKRDCFFETIGQKIGWVVSYTSLHEI